MKSYATIFFASALIAGCATPPPIQPPSIEIVDQPQINFEATAEIGETLLAKAKIYTFDGLELLEQITDNGIAREYIVEPHAMRLERIDQQGNKFYVPSSEFYYVNDKTFRKRVSPSNAYLVLKSDGSLELQGYYDLTTAGKISPSRPNHKIGKIIDRKQPNFRQELIYSGRSGNQIKVTYREYAGDFLRPGFTQDVQYDLGVENIIGFKGVRIQVVEATNTRLKYKVLRSFPSQP